MMILSEHIVSCDDLVYIKEDDCILNHKHTFVSISSLEDNNDNDGNYLVFDTKRKHLSEVVWHKLV